MNAPDDLWISWNSDEGWHSVNYKDHTSDGLPCVRYVRADLAAQPAPVPVPDWTQAPENATHFIYDYSGECGIWFDAAKVTWNDDGTVCIEDVIMMGAAQHYEHRIPLPLGIDWRTTLQRRPAADEVNDAAPARGG